MLWVNYGSVEECWGFRMSCESIFGVLAGIPCRLIFRSLCAPQANFWGLRMRCVSDFGVAVCHGRSQECLIGNQPDPTAARTYGAVRGCLLSAIDSQQAIKTSPTFDKIL